MNAGTVTLLVLAGISAVADWIAVARGDKKLEYVAKPLTLALLVLAALALDPQDPAARAWLVFGLLLSLAGDVFLMLPRDAFVAGLAAFFFAHLAYIVSFLASGVEFPLLALGMGVVTLGFASVASPIISAVRRGKDPSLARPVTAYVLIISVMVVAAVGTGNVVAMVGAGMFYVSDSLIASTRFRRELRWAPVAIMVTYHGAQGFLVTSLTT
jgi:uncharacterized membrane protein YhhN